MIWAALVRLTINEPAKTKARKVLLWLCAMCSRHPWGKDGDPVLCAAFSTREIAETVGLRHYDVARFLGMLEERGLIKTVHQGKGRQNALRHVVIRSPEYPAEYEYPPIRTPGDVGRDA